MRADVEDFDAEDNEEIVERVAAIDVAKASGKVCMRLPHASIPKRRVTRVWDVAATTNAVLGLADELIAGGVERVVVESTSDYWRPFVYLLQSAGVTTWLVNAHDVKQVPGRPKTDKIDAVWLAKLNERGMLRPSFIPPVAIRQLRDYTRLRSDLTADRTRHKQRVEKLLEDALIKLSTVATDIFGVSGRAMMEALINGERDPVSLAGMAKGRLRPKYSALVEAMTGRFDDHHADLARVLLHQIDALTATIDLLTNRIDDLIGPYTTVGRIEGREIFVQMIEGHARVHLDIETEDVDAEVARLETLGAERLRPEQSWWIMRDPSGQPFCVVPPQSPDFPKDATTWTE